MAHLHHKIVISKMKDKGEQFCLDIKRPHRMETQFLLVVIDLIIMIIILLQMIALQIIQELWIIGLF